MTTLTRYTIPPYIVVPQGRIDASTNMAHFLQENTGSIWGWWAGHMKAADQRRLFGQFLGKGTVGIDGERQRLTHSRKVCFGRDFEVTHDIDWKELWLWD